MYYECFSYQGKEISPRQICSHWIEIIDSRLYIVVTIGNTEYTNASRQRFYLLTAIHGKAPTPSCQPIGIRTAAISVTPLSVASRLNCAAAFLVSSTSTRMPSLATACLVDGLSGAMLFPVPIINMSVRSISLPHL